MNAREQQLLNAMSSAKSQLKPRDEQAQELKRASMVVLLGVFLLALSFAIVMGTTCYKSIHATGEAIDSARAASGVVRNAILATDASDSVEVEDGAEGSLLRLTERLDSGTFETRFYVRDGWLVEEYAIAGADANPDQATHVAEVSSFTVEKSGNLVVVSCNGQITQVALRSAGGGADA